MNKPEPIFIVDDDEGHAHLTESNLRNSGIHNEILHFSNGQSVLDYLYGTPKPTELPILILLDLNMPGISGKKVLKVIRSYEKTRTTPVVVLTTTDNPPEIDECYKLGCNMYLTKPVQYQEFARTIKVLGLVLQIVKLPKPASEEQTASADENALARSE